MFDSQVKEATNKLLSRGYSVAVSNDRDQVVVRSTAGDILHFCKEKFVDVANIFFFPTFPEYEPVKKGKVINLGLNSRVNHLLDEAFVLTIFGFNVCCSRGEKGAKVTVENIETEEFFYFEGGEFMSYMEVFLYPNWSEG